MLDKKFNPGLLPKRILSLDGGGIRGVVTLEFLERIESVLASRSTDPKSFRLSDYFDLIGGTSTGSIIAATLAFGLSVVEIKQLYHRLAKAVFKRSLLRHGVFIPKFPSQPLTQALDSVFRDATISSGDIRTGLVIMTKRLDTGSPWPIHNCPFSHYSESERKRRDAFTITQLVRASTAAPHYFKPEYLVDASGREATFVDGGVSTANNPALQLLMVASLKGYGFRWQLGEDSLLLVSVGTGTRPWRESTDSLRTTPALQLAGLALVSMMDDCDALVQTILQWMGRTRTPWPIDREIGDLEGDTLCERKQLTYLRYNLLLDRWWLSKDVGYQLSEDEISGLDKMDRPENVARLAEVGKLVASKQVVPEHFPAAFDLVE